jgi:hypothetical protein
LHVILLGDVGMYGFQIVWKSEIELTFRNCQAALVYNVKEGILIESPNRSRRKTAEVAL